MKRTTVFFKSKLINGKNTSKNLPKGVPILSFDTKYAIYPYFNKLLPFEICIKTFILLVNKLYFRVDSFLTKASKHNYLHIYILFIWGGYHSGEFPKDVHVAYQNFCFIANFSVSENRLQWFHYWQLKRNKNK